MQEDTDGGEEEVRIFRSVSADSNICWEGEEYQAGDLLLPGGQLIDAAAVAVGGWSRLPNADSPAAGESGHSLHRR